MPETPFHVLAKDAGNRLKSYILAYASGATGVFFLSLSDADAESYSLLQKSLLVTALLFFVVTVALCLIELHIDARRFYNVARQLDLPAEKQKWELNELYKCVRIYLLYGSYITVGLATLAAFAFLVARIV